jgi:hypothetical protein
MSRPISSSPAFNGHYCARNSPARPGMAAALDPPGFWFWSPDRRARVVTAFERFTHSERLDNVEREITIYNPSWFEQLRVCAVRLGTVPQQYMISLCSSGFWAATAPSFKGNLRLNLSQSKVAESAASSRTTTTTVCKVVKSPENHVLTKKALR